MASLRMALKTPQWLPTRNAAFRYVRGYLWFSEGVVGGECEGQSEPLAKAAHPSRDSDVSRAQVRVLAEGTEEVWQGVKLMAPELGGPCCGNDRRSKEVADRSGRGVLAAREKVCSGSGCNRGLSRCVRSCMLVCML